MKREYPQILKSAATPHDAIFIPEVYLYGTTTEKVKCLIFCKQWPLAPNSPKWQITRANVSNASHIFPEMTFGECERMYRVRGKGLANVGRMYRVRGKGLANGGGMYRVRGKGLANVG